MTRRLRVAFPGVSNWAERSTAAGVIRALPLQSSGSSDANLAGRASPTPGLSANVGVIPGLGDFPLPVIDTAVAPVGMAGSLRFDVGSQTADGWEGIWYANFSEDLSALIGENEEVYVQWRQRFDQNMIDTIFLATVSTAKTVTGITKANPGVVTCAAHGLVNGHIVVLTTTGMTEANGMAVQVASATADTFAMTVPFSGGTAIDTSSFGTFVSGTFRKSFLPSMKQAILSAGDTATKVWSSCAVNDIVVTDYAQQRFSTMYHSCGVYAGFYVNMDGGDLALQNERADPFCTFLQAEQTVPTAPDGCFTWAPDQWMTFQVYVKYGDWNATEQRFHNCQVKLWCAYEGGTQTLLLDANDDTAIGTWNPGTQNNLKLRGRESNIDQFLGKVWFSPYMTTKDGNHVHPHCRTWYSQLIISSEFIEDPT